jgi:pilus assembly protein CpaC
MKKYFLIIVFVISSLITLTFQGFATDEGAEELKLFVGDAKILPVESPTRIVIGNPNIADVTEVTKSEMTINPKAPGTTNLVFWDNFGEQSYKIKVVAENMDEIKRRIDNLLEKLNLHEVYTKAEEEEGKVMLLGRVKTPQDRERIATALGPLMGKTLDLIEVKEEESIVDIDVQVLELNKDATKTLGLTLPGSIALTEQGSAAVLGQTSEVGNVVGTAALQTTIAGTRLGSIFRVLNFSRDAFVFKLDMLIQEGKARVLSRPRLACQSGKEAELLVGGEKPVFTTSVAATTGATGTNVEYKEFGIKLKIKPTVTEENRIKLALNVEVSDVGEAEVIGPANAPTAKAYPLSKRTASTELFVNDAQSLAIGGLVKQKTEEDLRKFPWLADVPVLGMFFRQRVTKIGSGAGARGDTELFITLTPTIVSKEMPRETMASVKKVDTREREIEAYSQAMDLPPSLINYIRVIQRKITNATFYPRQAKNAGWEGNVMLSLNIASNGELKGTKILQSSGYKMLDDAALETARAQAPYPPFPPQINSQELWVDVPILYRKN